MFLICGLNKVHCKAHDKNVCLIQSGSKDQIGFLWSYLLKYINYCRNRLAREGRLPETAGAAAVLQQGGRSDRRLHWGPRGISGLQALRGKQFCTVFDHSVCF